MSRFSSLSLLCLLGSAAATQLDTPNHDAQQQYVRQDATSVAVESAGQTKVQLPGPGLAGDAKKQVQVQLSGLNDRAAKAGLEVSKAFGRSSPEGPNGGIEEWKSMLGMSQKIKKSFDYMDVNKDQEITPSDLTSMVEKFGKILGRKGPGGASGPIAIPGQKPLDLSAMHERTVRSFVDDMDADGDGRVDFKDYTAFVIKMSAVPNFAAEIQAKRDQALLDTLQDQVPGFKQMIDKKRKEVMAAKRQSEAGKESGPAFAEQRKNTF